MKTEKDFTELYEWQLNAFKQRDKYRQVLTKIKNKIVIARTELTQGDIKQYKSPSAIYGVEVFDDILKLINEVFGNE